MQTATAVMVVGLALLGCSKVEQTEGRKTPGARPVLPEVASAALQEQVLLGEITVLASDSFLGRLPGTVGEDRTVAYLEQQFKALGLEPGNPDGSYIQKVPLVGITPRSTPQLVVTKGSVKRVLAFKNDVVAWTKHVADSASIANSEMVFVGYGVQAPEFEWDDYKGLDGAGKTPGDVGQRPAARRFESVRRQGHDLLRPVDLQVRAGNEAPRGGGVDRPRDRAGWISIFCGAGEDG